MNYREGRKKMRLRNKPYAWDKIKEYPDYVIANPSEHQGKWQEVFGNRHPIHMELGTGRGDFIIGMAKQNPDVNFMGIEKYTSVIIDVLEKLLKNPLPNVRLINMDGERIEEVFAANELERIYLNFSDPWPKTRHHKRRLTHANFLSKYKKILQPDGEIHMKTDNQPLFEASLSYLSGFGYGLHNVSLDLHHSSFENNVMTEYEMKFSQKGNRIYRLEAKWNETKI